MIGALDTCWNTCEAFDPMKYYKVNRDADAESASGIQMVMKLA